VLLGAAISSLGGGAATATFPVPASTPGAPAGRDLVGRGGQRRGDHQL